MANNEGNLRVPTSEQARENGRKGGIASQKKQKQKKLMREDAQHFLEMPLSDKALDNIEFLSEVKGANITVQQAILLAMIKKAMKGDKQAAEYVRDTAGQKPIDSIDLNTNMSDSLANIMQSFQKGSDLE